ncbi:MobF family relaxase [Tessaracoccus lacteus]|uniref:MobF family relaxase n=1 Tax=Tessaracoccus lacteus TaxID=3041766 RepID=A0ABY8PXP5_9ACTN|nr:MobF family relaxase [Tessaracoccus sp. T21]WGT47275.1 MobF family relaxase [Tessaracoccus sp. T21]
MPSDATRAMVTEAARLGQSFPVHGAVNEFRLEVEKRTAAWRVSEGVPTTVTVPTDVRADIVNHVARETFEARIGRLPTAPELAAEVSRLSRQPSTACAGFDMTFTPVKSVSALWAIAPRDVAEAIERAHDAAVDDALRFLEDEALYSRAGHAGVRQIDVRGFIAASFTHRDSRAGDPNLHTHVAIANKVVETRYPSPAQTRRSGSTPPSDPSSTRSD